MAAGHPRPWEQAWEKQQRDFEQRLIDTAVETIMYDASPKVIIPVHQGHTGRLRTESEVLPAPPQPKFAKVEIPAAEVRKMAVEQMVQQHASRLQLAAYDSPQSGDFIRAAVADLKADQATLNAILKTYYLPAIKEQLNQELFFVHSAARYFRSFYIGNRPVFAKAVRAEWLTEVLARFGRMTAHELQVAWECTKPGFDLGGIIATAVEVGFTPEAGVFELPAGHPLRQEAA